MIAYREPYTSCSSLQKGFFGETEELKRYIDRVETVTVRRRESLGQATGTIHLEADGQVVDEPFQIDESGGIDTAFTSQHVGARSFEDGLQSERALAEVYSKLLRSIRAAEKRANEKRAQPVLAAAQVALKAGNVTEADHQFFLASQITRQAAPEFSLWLKSQHHLDEWTIKDVVAGGVVATVEEKKTGLSLPTIPEEEIEANKEWTWNQAINGSDFQSVFMFSITAGLVVTRADSIAQSAYGANAQLAVTVLNHGTQHFRQGFDLRLGGGAGSRGSKYVDMDVMLLGALKLGGFTIGPVLGLGADTAPGYQDAPLVPTTLVVPLGAYAEVGGRGSFSLGYGLSIEGIYTYALRTSSDLPVEQRIDIRLRAFAAFTFRYASYQGKGAQPGGQQLWFLAGFGL